MARFGQSLSNWARLDVPNKLARNGELLVQRSVVERSAGNNPVFFDVGANVGDWTLALLRVARELQTSRVSIHAFEPCAGTRQTLSDTIKRNDTDGVVKIVPLAMSNAGGLRSFYVIGAGAGRNSLYPNEARSVEQVEAATLDDYCTRNNVARIALVKVDTEGHDMSVIEGAKRLLTERRIDVLQFEYNHLWVSARHYLKDVFDFAGPVGYSVAKITPVGVERYAKWHPELETFREANYILATDESIEWFPAVRWWNA
ncbi:MAG: FkbM family methyltransferase [Gemmatimonadaceae bacterium]